MVCSPYAPVVCTVSAFHASKEVPLPLHVEESRVHITISALKKPLKQDVTKGRLECGPFYLNWHDLSMSYRFVISRIIQNETIVGAFVSLISGWSGSASVLHIVGFQ